MFENFIYLKYLYIKYFEILQNIYLFILNEKIE